MENVKFQDIIQVVKSLELKDYPMEDFWGENHENSSRFFEIMNSYLKAISQQEMNRRKLYTIPSKIWIKMMGKHNPHYICYFTRTK